MMQRAITSNRALGLLMAGLLSYAAAEVVAADPVFAQVQYKQAKVYFCCQNAKGSKFQRKAQSGQTSGQPLTGAETFTFKTVPSPTKQEFRWWYEYGGGK